MDQTAGSTPADAPAPAQSDSGPTQAPPAEQPGFGSRGRARRRARFLRRARELAYRDLGGLVFNLHRFGQRNDALVLAKLGTLTRIDSELRAIEDVLRERRPLTVLREAGITACPRCAAIHGSEDRFCPNCGFSVARNVDLPIAGAATVAQTEPPAGMPVAPAPAPAPMAPGTAPALTPATPPSTTSQVPAPAPTALDPAPPPSPAQDAPVAAPPAASETDAPGPITGRSPLPAGSGGGEPAQPGETTEILRPQTGGS